jgi:predicted P-loop ATPase
MSECPICNGVDTCQVDKLFVTCRNSNTSEKVKGYKFVHKSVRSDGWVWEPESVFAELNGNGHSRQGVNGFEMLGDDQLENITLRLADVKKEILSGGDKNKLEIEKIELQAKRTVLKEKEAKTRSDRHYKRLTEKAERIKKSKEEASTSFEKDSISIQNLLEGKVRFNSLKGRIEFDGNPISLDCTRAELSRLTGFYRWHSSDDAIFKMALDFAMQNAYCPIQQYLATTEEKYEETVDHTFLDDLGTTIFGVTSEVQNAFFKATMIGAVRRAFYPGCQHDYMLILYSKNQGQFKSSVLKELFGKEFTGEGQIPMGDKDSFMMIAKNWVHEVAECDITFRSRDSSAMKDFITHRSDLFRPPYGRSMSEQPRRTVIFGTTNHREFLTDETGNRRFPVLEVPEGFMCNIEFVKENRDKIFAAALDGMYRGIPNQIPEELFSVAATESKSFMSNDPWEIKILEFIELPDQRGVDITIPNILDNCLKIEPGRQERTHELRVGKILRLLGYEKKRESTGARRRIFVKGT